MGEGGANIRALRQDTGARIKVTPSKVKDGLVPVTIKGPPEECANAKEAIQELFINDEESVRVIWLSKAQCGMIVGKRGETIDALRQDTGTWISIDPSGGKDGLVPVTIKGPAEAFARAEKAIKELIEESVLLIPEDKVGLVCGKEGWLKSKIMAESGAFIVLKTESITDGCVKVSIHGTEEQRSSASRRITDIVESAPY